MSYKLQPLVWAADLPGTIKLVLLKLCDHANDDGSRVYPSIPSVARGCGIGERTVQDAMKQLRAASVLVQVRPADFSKRRPVEYRIDVRVLETLGSMENRCEDCIGANSAPVQEAREPVREPRPAGAVAAPKSTNETSNEPPIKRTNKRPVEYFVDDESMDPVFAKVAAELNFPDERTSAEWAKCRDWHLSQAKGTANSKATYRNWITRAIEFSRAAAARGSVGRKPSAHQAVADGTALAIAAARARKASSS